MTPNQLQVLSDEQFPDFLTDTDVARIFRHVYGGQQFDSTERMFAAEVEAAVRAKFRDTLAAIAQQAQPAPLAGEVTDERIVSALESAGVRFLHIKNGVSGKKDFWTTLGCQDVHKITDGVRAILALRPQTVPMTDDQIVQGQEQQGAQSILSFMKGVRCAEAHHGITAKAEGVKP